MTPRLKRVGVAWVLSAHVARGVVCASDRRLLLHPLLTLASARLLLFKLLSSAWWSVPAVGSMLGTQGLKGSCLLVRSGVTLPQCSPSSSHLAEPVLPGSAHSSCGLPCGRQCVSLLPGLSPNPFHTWKIPCQCFWMCRVGLQAPTPAGVREWQPGPGLGSQFLVLQP